MTQKNRFIKRSFDLAGSLGGLLLLWWLIFIALILATLDTHKLGIFIQTRVGKNGDTFNVIKIRSMRDMPTINTSVTRENDPRITQLGHFWRKTKIDELPQLINVLFGHMSFVGPRPDVPGFADQLQGAERLILSVRPGITGPATLFFRNEEKLLAEQDNPEVYNKEIIWPEKIRLNQEYINNYTFSQDLKYIYQTIIGNTTIC